MFALVRTCCPLKPREAKQELLEGLRALDQRDEDSLPASIVVTALKRMGLELQMTQKETERSLRTFEVSPRYASPLP